MAVTRRVEFLTASASALRWPTFTGTYDGTGRAALVPPRA